MTGGLEGEAGAKTAPIVACVTSVTKRRPPRGGLVGKERALVQVRTDIRVDMPCHQMGVSVWGLEGLEWKLKHRCHP